MNWAGAAAGANDALQDMLVQRRAAFLQQEQLKMQQAAQAQQAAQLAALEQERAEDRKHRDRVFQSDEAERTRTRRTEEARTVASLVGPGSELAQEQAATFKGTPYEALLDTKQTLPSRTVAATGVDISNPGGREHSVLKPTHAQAQEAGRRSASLKVVDLVRRGAPRQEVLGAMQEAGQELRPADLADPDKEYQRTTADRRALVDLQHRNELEQIRTQGAESRATAGVRTSGTRDATTQRRIDAKAKGFDANPTVKRAQAMAEAASFAKSLKDDTTNPADDQALIYNYAKSMDPDSAVREGEYATIQKYAQSLAERLGFNAARVFSNTTFLTPEARKNLKASIVSRYQSTRGQYDSLRKAYVDQIAGMGGDDGDLIDYGAGFPSFDDAAAPPAPGAGPAPGETRVINGVKAVWDGKGWKRAQ